MTGLSWSDGQPERLLQGRLADSLAGKVFGAVVRGYVGVCFRAPLVVIDAVDDAVEDFSPCPQYALKPRSEFRGLDLLAVFLAYGIDNI